MITFSPVTLKIRLRSPLPNNLFRLFQIIHVYTCIYKLRKKIASAKGFPFQNIKKNLVFCYIQIFFMVLEENSMLTRINSIMSHHTIKVHLTAWATSLTVQSAYMYLYRLISPHYYCALKKCLMITGIYILRVILNIITKYIVTTG